MAVIGELTVPGVGDLAPVEGTPDGVSCWSADEAGFAVNVVVEEPATTDDLDLAFIASVVADREELLAVAAGAAADFLDSPREGFRAPELTFYPGREWLVRFAECAAPGLTELGVAVLFDDRAVVEVDDLADVGSDED